MKRIAAFLIVAGATILSCHSNSDVLPTDIWAEGCVELAPYQGAYRLTGMCCAYVLIPKIELTKNNSFAVNGSYRAFTGAGYGNVPIRLTGQLAADGNELIISYSLNASAVTHKLTPGPAKMACFCGCD